MAWIIILIIAFICAFWFVGRIYSKDKDIPKNGVTPGNTHNINNDGSGSDNGG